MGLFDEPAAPRKQWADIEERVGMSWLVKIGISALVIGLVLLLNEVVPRMGKGGKVALAYTLSVALLALGVRGEKSEKYRNIARVVLGGGWAATYGTTYALHNVSAVQVVESPVLGFLLLFGVAAGIVAHSLRYDSQTVTGFAYVLGFVTVVLGQMNLWTMVASALLAVSLVVVLKMRRWYWLEPVGIAATYIVHWAWLRQVFEGLADRKQFADFKASAVLLTVYWVIFTASHFLRDDREREQKLWLTGAFLLNVAGYLAVMRYQSLYPELRFWFLLGVGTTYLVLCGAARAINRRLAFLLASTLGVALLVVAIPYRYSGARLEFIWLLEAEALLFIGWRLAEPHLRNLGWGAAAVLAPYVIYHDIVDRVNKWQEPDRQLGMLLLFIGLAYLANERFVQRFLKDTATQIDRGAAMIAGPVATLMLLTAAFVAFPYMWVAVAWAGLALALWEYGHRLDDQTLRYCGIAAALFAVFRLVIVNVQKAPAAGAANLRVWTTVLAVAICFVLARRMRSAQAAEAPGPPIQEFFGRGPAAMFAWVATVPASFLAVAEAAKHKPHLFLSVPEVTWGLLGLAALAIFISYPIAVGLLMTATWLALPYMWTALVWTGLAVAVSEIGLRRKDGVLRTCGHVAALLAIARLLLVNMQYAPPMAGANQRVVTVALAVAVFYLFARRMSPAKSEPELETSITDEIVWRGGMPAVYTWLGALLAGLLIWNEVTRAAVGLAWAMLGLALVEVAKPLADRALRAQGYTLLALSFVRLCIADLNMGAAEGISPRLVTVTLLAAIYYYSAFTADKELTRLPAVLLWLGTSGLVALLRFELAEHWVSVAWATATVALFFLGRWLRRDAFVYQAYLLTLLVAMRAAFDDFDQADTRMKTVVAVSVLFYLLLGTSLFEKKRRLAAGAAAITSDRPRWLEAVDTNPQHLFFFVPTILLTVLLYLEVPRSYLTAAWGAEGVVVFLIALRLGERAFRLFSLGLILLCVGRLVLMDVWAFDPIGRIISFMGLGVASLLVGFLYTKNREKWRRYL